MSNPDLIDKDDDGWTWITNDSGDSGYVTKQDLAGGLTHITYSRESIERVWGPVREVPVPVETLVFKLPEMPDEVTNLRALDSGKAFTRDHAHWVEDGDEWHAKYTLGELLEEYGPLVPIVKTPEERALETLRNSPYPWEQNIMEYGDENLYQAMRLVVNKALNDAAS